MRFYSCSNSTEATFFLLLFVKGPEVRVKVLKQKKKSTSNCHSQLHCLLQISEKGA